MTTSEPRPPQPATADPMGFSRIDWIDFAKAAAIVLVVLFHVTDWYARAIVPGIGGPGFGVWREVSLALIPVRIPLFFLVSGILAASAIHRTWGALGRTRIRTLIWPFLLWTTLIIAPWSLRVNYDHPGANLELSWQSVVFGGAHFWYLPALAIFLVVARAVRRTPRVAIIGAAVLAFVVVPLVSSLLGSLGPILGANLVRWPTFLFWFILGCFARRAMVRFAEWPWMIAIGGIAVFAGLRWVLVTQGALPGLSTALSVVGVGTAVLLARAAVRIRALARLGRFLAARTLPIYVGHAFLFESTAVLAEWARRRGFVLSPDGGVLDAVFVPLAVVAAVAITVGVYEFARRIHLGWLYAPPAWLFGGDRPKS